MTYIGPNFQIVTSEELKVGMLRENENNEIVGFEEIELLMGDTTTKIIMMGGAYINDTMQEYTKELPLCKAGDNKHWVLGEDGKIKKQYLR
tara:strand:- start:73 stop:345 length:273 start_codon:yes stop_codon:yes gene_type:complete